MTKFTLAASEASADFPERISTGHMTKEHCDHLCPAGKALCPTFCLMLVDQVSKFSARKMMKQLTKQACYLYHVSALSGDCDGTFFIKKILHHNLPGGHPI
jgi:hypothetical protein